MSESALPPTDQERGSAIPAEGLQSPSVQPGAVPISGAQLLGPFGVSLGAPGLAVQQLQLWQGQFPPPDAVEHYEQLLPGVFDRIVRMAEEQSAASISGTTEARKLLQSDTARGQWLGWSLAVLAIASAVLLGMTNHPAVATVLVAVPVMSVAVALINGVRFGQAKGKASAPPTAPAPSQSTPPKP
jgi:uncharacterized membrane protein